MNLEKVDYSFKIVLVGNCGVGKSNILSRYIKDKFDHNSDSTIGVAFATKNLNIDGKKIKLDLWDTAGQERFRAISRAYYRGASGVILVYDVTKYESFDQCINWLNLLEEYTEKNIPIILVGNKKDLASIVPSQEAQNFAKKYNMLFCEASALNRENIDFIFNSLIKQIYCENLKENSGKTIELDPKKNTVEITEKPINKSNCC